MSVSSSPGISLAKIGVLWAGGAAVPSAACEMLSRVRALAVGLARHGTVTPQPAGIHTKHRESKQDPIESVNLLFPP